MPVRSRVGYRIATRAATAAALLALLVAEGAQAGPKRVAAAGDIACDSRSSAFNGGFGTSDRCRQAATSDLIVGGNYDTVLTLGDTQYRNGELEQFLASYDLSWGRFKSITRPVVGNHEYNVAGAAGYFDYFNGVGARSGPAGRRGRGYYSFDLGRWHLVALNSNCREVACGRGSKQWHWLRRDLRRGGGRCLLAYWHHPRFSSGGHQGSSTRTKPFWRLLQAAGAELVLSGHDHDYERFAPQRAGGKIDRRRGIRQFVVGTGGNDLLPLRRRRHGSRVAFEAFGVIALRLGRAGYRWAFESERGRILDRGSSRCR